MFAPLSALVDVNRRLPVQSEVVQEVQGEEV
jgi:hypothetical protein